MLNRLEKLTEICARFEVGVLYLFGSRAKEVKRWLEKPDATLADGRSDVDIGVKAKFGTSWSMRQKVRLAQALEELMGCNVVDLIDLDQADAFLAVDVIRGERVYSQDRYHADEYDLYVLGRAGDLALFERERHELIMQRHR